MRLAWFSPMPPNRSGIAAYSAEILPILRSRYDALDVFVDRVPIADEHDVFSAHDFVWKQRRRPYDLTVFQMGNALCHGYMWAYLFRYPGLVVLHDAQLHQARALWLMKRHPPRYDDYISEFRATEPHAPPEAAYVIAAGLGEAAFYQHWPLVRLVLESARLAVVHNEWLRTNLAERYPNATIDAIEMGVADVKGAPAFASDGRAGEARASVLSRHQIPGDAILLAAFGGVTPEKRIGPLIRAVGELRDRIPRLHLMLVGDQAEHYDARADAKRWGVTDRVHITGYVGDEDLPAYLAAADMCSCLRWPSNRETSASWLRCLAAGRPTLITTLAQHLNLPDIAVSIDVLEEDRALPNAIESLAVDAARRARLGEAARRYWEARHRLDHMAEHYERVITRAMALAPPRPDLPPHMRDDGSGVLRTLADQTGMTTNLADILA